MHAVAVESMKARESSETVTMPERSTRTQTDALQDKQTGKGETNAYPSGNRMEGTGLIRENADGYPSFRPRKSEDEKVMVDGTGALDSLPMKGKTMQISNPARLNTAAESPGKEGKQN